MKRALKYLLISLAALVVVLPVLYVGAVCVALRAHAKHDAIIFGGKRVQEAVSEYIEKHGKPPQKLEDLVPECLDAIPAIAEVSKTEYRLSDDGNKWTLNLYRTNRNVLLVYRRTNAPLSAEDTKRTVEIENGCYVLKAD
jgi:hypothetical protein